MRIAGAVLVLVLLALRAGAATPVSELATPPADAKHFTIISSAGKHGESSMWTTPDGTLHARESMLLRGQVFETDSIARTGADGMLDQVTVRGFTPNGDAAETFVIEKGTATWKSPVDGGSAAYAAPAMYVAFGGPIALTAVFADRLLAAPDHALSMLPGGKARAEKLVTQTIGDGAAKRIVTAWSVTGLFNTPVAFWADDHDHFFALVTAVSWIPAGYETAMKALQDAQDAALAKRSPQLVKQLLKTPKGPVAFTNVRAFLGGDHFAEGQTVVVDKGVIVAAGPAASTEVPKGAEILDGAGKTLVPGLWDAHQHFPGDAAGPMLLSLGITSVRDPGNVNELTLARAARRAKGELLSPRVYPSMLIDGKGPNSAQSGTTVTSQDEALAAVRKAKQDGFTGIKIYGSFDPAWVKATAAEAHRLGLHVHGHLPAGMRTKEAIEDGYDEITHIYFVMMQAMPDDVVNKSNGMARFEGPGRYAKDVDLDAEPMKSLIAMMAARKISADPTLVVAEGLYVPENGDLSPAYAPYVGTMPPFTERGFRQGGFAVPAGLTRADYRASFAKLSELVGRLHKAGVNIVAGTDGTGIELVRELELYVAAGFTNAEALAAATIAPARLVGADSRTGSIAVGKAADLVLVDGDPSTTIGDLRHTRIVMMDGKLMEADALRAAGGFEGRPKFME
ncbi:MAG TPA: amidohydrolase family protein [Stellaceae bacterium]|nr:amidohydrolase family protein [Stellaceae bacterium]